MKASILRSVRSAVSRSSSSNRLLTRTFATESVPERKVAVLGAAGGIGQPLALLMKLNPLVSKLALYDIAGTPGVAADVGHVNTRSEVNLVTFSLFFHGYEFSSIGATVRNGIDLVDINFYAILSLDVHVLFSAPNNKFKSICLVILETRVSTCFWSYLLFYLFGVQSILS